MVDALGGPAEFRQRFSFPTVTSMISNGNFNLPPGVWTDDTSMTLCLAHSVSTSKTDSNRPSPYEEGGGFDEHDQMAAYTNWRKEGFLSAIGRCFDVGTTVSGAISFYSRCDDRDTAFEKIKEAFGDESCSGNGSLMRVVPVGLAYWRDEGIAREYARRSSVTTHPNETCQEACEVWTGAISMIMKTACSTSGESQKLSKLHVLEYFAAFPYKVAKLRDALSLPPTAPQVPEDEGKKERHYRSHHPIMKLVEASDSFFLPRQNKLFPRIPDEKKLPSSGYVLHTLIAALYSFFATSTFEEGAMFAVNLGDDADTVGAVYGGLAGCWYGHEQNDSPKESVKFWSERVEGWKDALVERGMVEGIAEKLVSFSAKLAQGQR
ncbi:ADP-ribosylglycohydrolase [Marasmius fiardii PR-910]|nr:ADP-ribosylglycohydrolase [Marasmius fiardii PR-910]